MLRAGPPPAATTMAVDDVDEDDEDCDSTSTYRGVVDCTISVSTSSSPIIL